MIDTILICSMPFCRFSLPIRNASSVKTIRLNYDTQSLIPPISSHLFFPIFGYLFLPINRCSASYSLSEEVQCQETNLEVV
jgi:hypothetical protein